MSLLPVAKLDMSQFELAEVIGQGQSAIVQKAYWRSNKNQIVAVKKLKFNTKADLEKVVNKLRTVKHKNVITIHGYIEDVEEVTLYHAV